MATFFEVEEIGTGVIYFLRGYTVRLRKPLKYTWEKFTNGEVLVAIPLLQEYGAGHSIAEALLEVEGYIWTTYKELKDYPDAGLGEELLRIKQELKGLIS